MLVHHFDRVTGQHLFSEAASIDPLETARCKLCDPLASPIYLLPAHATFLSPPPPRAGRAIVFNGKQWLYVRPRQTQPLPRGLIGRARLALRSIFCRPRAA